MSQIRVVAIDMGYGHLRPAHAIAEMLGTEVLEADKGELVRDKDQKQWAYIRRYYESLSRASQVPVLGAPLRLLLDAATDIRELYAARDQSGPTIGTRILDRMIQDGLGATLVDHLAKDQATLVTTFYMPAVAADRLGYDRIFCVVTDSDINRVWAPIDPPNTRITYLVPAQRTRRRLRAYGVPEERIRVTGFPLPHSLVGGVELPLLKSHLAKRLVRLDPQGVFHKDLKHALSHALGNLPTLSGDEACVTLTFAVGGAGAQAELVTKFLPSLRGLIAEGRLKVALVAGIRRAVAEQLRDCIESAGLGRHFIPPGKVEVLYEPSFDAYLKSLQRLLARTDILWTKPSEMTFYAGLGLPLLFAPAVGTHERYNRRWARELGCGLKQRDLRYTGEWLKDWLKDGTLAGAAWNGFTRAPSYGLYQILEAIGGHNTLEQMQSTASVELPPRSGSGF